MKTDENITYKCPLCSYKSKKKAGVIGHYRFTHGGGKGKIPDEDIVILRENGEEEVQEPQTEKTGVPIDIPKPVVPLNTNVGTSTSKSVMLAGADLALVEGLEKSGFGTNLNDIMRKALHFSANTIMNQGGANMAKEDMDPIEKLQKQRLLDVQIKSMEKDATSGTSQSSPDDFEKIERMMMQKMRMKMMESMANGGTASKEDFGLKDIMQFQFLKDMMRENKPSVDPAMAQMMQDLRSEIQSLRNEKDQQAMIQRFESLIPKNNSGDSMDKFYAMVMAKDKDGERTRMEMMQKEKEFMAQLQSKDKETLQIALNMQIQKLNEEMQSMREGSGFGKNQLNQMKDQIEIIKELNKMVKGGNPETSKWDAAKGILEGVADKLNPSIQSYFESKNRPSQPYPMQDYPQPPVTPQEYVDTTPQNMPQQSNDTARSVVDIISMQDTYGEQMRKQQQQ